MLDPERCSELAFLVEIEAPLLRRHRIDRRTVDEDDLGLEIRIARGRPRELRRIVAVDEDEVLLYLDEIERIDAMTGTRNQITLLVPNVALDRDGRIIIPASRHARRSDPVDRLRSEEHTSELQSLMRNPDAVVCLKKKKQQTNIAILSLNTR